jgi:dethiobiotin synthetase
MSKKYFVTGIGTDVGKTVISAILVEALQADYWKPIQSGDLHFSDTDKVRSWVSNRKSVFHPSEYAFKEPASPHYSAALENSEIDINRFTLPETDNHLIVEGAGGLMVPLNDKHLLIDLIQKMGLEVILVARNYLGSINHTLLSIEALRSRKIPVKGIIFNGQPTPSSEEFILNYSGVTLLGVVNTLDEVNSENIHIESIRFRGVV